MKALILKGQLALMDDQAGVESAAGDGFEDTIEGHHLVAEAVRQQQSQCQKGGGQSSWDCDPRGWQIARTERFFCHDHGTVFVPHAASTGQKGILVEEMGVGMNADGRHVELAAQRSAVERLDILKLMTKLQVAGVELVMRQGVKHESVVRVGAM